MDHKAFELPNSNPQSTHPPPFIPLANIHNLRSIDLLPLPNFQSPSSNNSTSSSQHVLKPGLLFRSADPYNADPHALQKLGIKTVFDLRSLPEVEKGLGWAASKEGEVSPQEGITRIWTPVFEAEDYNPERLAERFAMYMDESTEGFVKAYFQILSHGGPAYRLILQHLATEDSGGILVHCTAGKDRTGMLFGILFSLLGATDQAIADEYQLTEIGLSELRPVFIRNIVVRLRNWAESGEKEGAVDLPATEEEREKKWRAMAERSTSARKESMLASLVMLREKFGGPEGYIKNVCGLDDGVIAALKKNLVITAEEAKAEPEKNLP